MKKENDYPLILILSYSQDLFEIAQLEGHHCKFTATKEDVEEMNAVVLAEYRQKLTEEERLSIK